MSIIFWTVTILDALAFLSAGSIKLMQPKEKLEPMMKWVVDFNMNTIKTIGLLEVLGAIGLILPRLTNILPWLSSLAAIGLILTLIGGAIIHLRRGDPFVPSIIPNIVLGAFSAVALLGTLSN